MKAYVLHGINDIRYEEVSAPSLQENEVLVKVMAAGVCGSDIPRIYRDGAHRMPLIPGHEFAGEVVQCTERTAQWQGKRVGIFPLIPCKACAPCKQKKYEMCRKYSYLGSRCDGGFAEYVAVPGWNLIELSPKVKPEAVAMMEPMAVAVHAMRAIAPGKSDTIVVSGLGTIGLLLLMFLKQQGFERILAIGNKEFQRQKSLELGIRETEYYDSRAGKVSDWILEQTGNLGADIFFECVGTQENILTALSSSAPGGKLMMIGNPASDMVLDKNTYWKILRHQLTIMGTWNSSFTGSDEDDWHYVKLALESGTVHPEQLITHRFPLAELEKGLHIMRDKTEDYVKIMVKH